MSDDAQIDRTLADAATTFDLPPGDVEAVIHRGRRRARRKRAAVATMTTVAMVAGTVTAFGVLDGGDRGVPVAAGGGVRRGESGIRWQRVTSGSALGFARSIDGSGPVYALSTAPGDVDPNPRNHSRVLWRSDDGVEWQSVSKLGDDLFLSDLSSAGGRIYAVGTGPATAAVQGPRSIPNLLVGWSDDEGRTWRKATLPFDLRGIAARTTSSGVSFTEVAAGPRGTVAVAVPYAVLDVAKMLPPGVTAPNGWAITDTGVDLLGPRSPTPCPPGTSDAPPQPPPPPPAGAVPATPTEMPPPPGEMQAAPTEVPPAPGEMQAAPGEAPPPPGQVTATTGPPARVTATTAPAVQAEKPSARMVRPPPTTGEVHPTFCFRGEADPVEVSPQQAHGVAGHYSWEQLGVGDDLLRAVRNQPVAFAAGPGSTDFERVELPDAGTLQAPITVQADEDGFDLVGARWSGRDGRRRNGPPAMAALHSDDGRKWSEGDLAVPGVGWVAAAGPLGDRTTLIGAGEQGDPVLLRSDGTGGWTTAPFGGVVPRPAGSQLAVVSAAVGPFGAVAVVAVVPPKPEGPPAMAPGPVEQSPDFRLLVSRDGVVWDDHPLDDLAGAQVNGISTVVVTRDQAVVTAILGHDVSRPGQKAQRATLVGTLD